MFLTAFSRLLCFNIQDIPLGKWECPRCNEPAPEASPPSDNDEDEDESSPLTARPLASRGGRGTRRGRGSRGTRGEGRGGRGGGTPRGASTPRGAATPRGSGTPRGPSTPRGRGTPRGTRGLTRGTPRGTRGMDRHHDGFDSIRFIFFLFCSPSNLNQQFFFVAEGSLFTTCFEFIHSHLYLMTQEERLVVAVLAGRHVAPRLEFADAEEEVPPLPLPPPRPKSWQTWMTFSRPSMQ